MVFQASGLAGGNCLGLLFLNMDHRYFSPDGLGGKIGKGAAAKYFGFYICANSQY